ncbi:hypothetical protein C1646_765468 [Rhizophagus diaphanus]|nr:hypothetical protein C1646_765468 [Rhizophagus diaphanus] [Rhizophagus sp. MUCL 43196]
MYRANWIEEYTEGFIKVPHEVYDITREPITKFCMLVWNEICENYTQLSVHNQYKYASVLYKILEWMPYDRNYNIKHIANDRIEANWIDGCTSCACVGKGITVAVDSAAENYDRSLMVVVESDSGGGVRLKNTSGADNRLIFFRNDIACATVRTSSITDNDCCCY